MLIAEAESAFRAFIVQRGHALDRLQPEDLLALGFDFYEAMRASDALPATDECFGDALLFQWGTREALPPHHGACYYLDLTRQFTSQVGDGDDAMFQLQCQLQYELTPALRAVTSGERWCGSLDALPAFKAFAFAHPALAAVAGLSATAMELQLSPI